MKGLTQDLIDSAIDIASTSIVSHKVGAVIITKKGIYRACNEFSSLNGYHGKLCVLQDYSSD